MAERLSAKDVLCNPGCQQARASANQRTLPPENFEPQPPRETLKKQKKKQPDGCFFEDLKVYLVAAALMRALKRDLYRAAVFLWIVPFCTALSMIDTVSPTPV